MPPPEPDAQPAISPAASSAVVLIIRDILPVRCAASRTMLYCLAMIINTPPLATKTVNVVPLLFKAQLPDTLNQIRQAIPDWTAVHVVADAAIKRGATPQEIQAELLNQLKPTAALLDPIYTLSNPAIPPNTLFTLVPDRVRPTFAAEYDLWKYVYYSEARGLLEEFFDRAMGGIPEGRVGL